MGHIAIRLNAATLENPDLDLRYCIPDLLAEASCGSVQDDGYDYSETDASALTVYLRSDDPDKDVHCVIETLAKNEVCGNWLLPSAVIGVSKDARSFKVVHPPDHNGQFVVRAW